MSLRYDCDASESRSADKSVAAKLLIFVGAQLVAKNGKPKGRTRRTRGSAQRGGAAQQSSGRQGEPVAGAAPASQLWGESDFEVSRRGIPAVSGDVAQQDANRLRGSGDEETKRAYRAGRQSRVQSAERQREARLPGCLRRVLARSHRRPQAPLPTLRPWYRSEHPRNVYWSQKICVIIPIRTCDLSRESGASVGIRSILERRPSFWRSPIAHSRRSPTERKSKVVRSSSETARNALPWWSSNRGAS